ncbi:hypothetical protein C8K44_1285 [Aminobacter sp. AP02]|nr:hypothetical protein C8K44_1285 [Aminobacter sp. AP02]
MNAALPLTATRSAKKPAKSATNAPNMEAGSAKDSSDGPVVDRVEYLIVSRTAAMKTTAALPVATLQPAALMWVAPAAEKRKRMPTIPDNA